MSSTVEIVTELDDLHVHADGWRELAVARGNGFMTPEWYLAWFRAFGEGATPSVAIRHDGGPGLAGVWPLVASGGAAKRTLRFAGGSLGDLFSPLDRESDRELVRAALERARSAYGHPAVRLDHVDAEAEWVRGLGDGGERITELAHLAGVLPEIEIAGTTWEEYLSKRSRNLRSQLGRRLRKLERDHEVRFRLTDGARLSGDLEAFFRLHQDRWTSRGAPGALADSGRLAFHREFAKAALEQGWLRLWIVEVDERPAAAWYGWHVGDRYSYYLAGFDQAYADYSIGLLLLAHTIRHAIEEGAAVYELLLGTEDFKQRFATGERAVRTLIVSSRLHPTRLAALAEVSSRRALGRFSPETRARLVQPVRALTSRRAP